MDHTLFARKLFGGSSSSSNHTCPMPSNLLQTPQTTFVAGYTFREFNMIFSGACTAFSILTMFLLMAMHATHFSRPNEQGKIMRLCFMIPLYAGLNFITIPFPNSYMYVVPWVEYFQSVALSSFFLLLAEMISPNVQAREAYIASMQIIKKKKGEKTLIDGIKWYRQTWLFVFQYVPVAIIVAIATDATQGIGVYCLESSKPYFAHLWLEIIINVSLGVAVMAIIKWYAQLKDSLKHHRPLAKLLAFKGLVFLTFLETILFWILRSTNVLKPTATLTYADVNMGIQQMLICFEMVFFSIFFWYAYDFRPYLLSHSHPLTVVEEVEMVKDNSYGPQNSYQHPSNGISYQGGFLGIRAWFEAVNPMDTIRGVAFALRMATEMRKSDNSQQDRY